MCHDSQRKPKRTYWTKEEAERFSAFLRSCIYDASTPDSQAALKAAGKCARDWHVLLDDQGKYRFMQFTCGRKFCPSCLMAWSRELTTKTTHAVSKLNPYNIRHITLTVPNAPQGRLKERTEALYKARREWTNEGHRAKGRGGFLSHEEGIAWKHEVHWSGKAGWHPHLHMLIDAPGGVDCRRGSNARDAWVRITKRLGAEANDAHGVFITSFARSRTRNADETVEDWGKRVAAEMAKYAAKPIPLRGLSRTQIDELADSSAGRRFTNATGSMAVAQPKGQDAGWQYCGLLSSLGMKHLTDVFRKKEHGKECDPQEGWKIMQAFEQHARLEDLKVPAHLSTFVEAAKQERTVTWNEIESAASTTKCGPESSPNQEHSKP